MAALGGIAPVLGLVVSAAAAADAGSPTLPGGEPPALVLHSSPRSPGVPSCGVLHLQLRPRQPNRGDGAPILIALPVPGSVTVEIGDAEQVEISARDGPCWTPTVTVDPALQPALELRAHPSGKVSGEAIAAEVTGELDIADLEATVLLTADDGGPAARIPRGLSGSEHTTCVVDGQRFSCAVPGGLELGLRLEVAGRAPVYLWSLEVVPGGSLDLGRVRFRPGASVSGWIHAAGLDDPPSVSAVPATSTRLPGDDIRAVGVPCPLTERGHFQCLDLPPGEWFVVVESPPGLVRARSSPFSVRTGGETDLGEPIEVPELARVVFIVEPPVAPDGGPWLVLLFRTPSGFSAREEVAREEASGAGDAELSGLPPGRYVVELRDREGSSWLRLDHDVEAGAPPVLLEVSGVPVQGHLQLDGEPQAGSVRLTSRHGERVVLRAQEDGELVGFMPREGQWRAYVSLSGQEGEIDLGSVRIERSPGQGVAELDLELPATEVKGVVVDEEGRPAGGAVVMARDGRGALAFSRACAEGAFRLVGLWPGRSALWAEAPPDLASAELSFELEDGKAVEDLELVISAKKHLRVRIVGPYGPVPGASIHWSTEGSATVNTTSTRANGVFEIVIPGGTRTVALLVRALGLPGAVRQVLVTEGDEAIPVQLAEAGGHLVIPLGDVGPSAALGRDGVLMPLRAFFDLAGGVPPPELDLADGSLRLDLEPGSWWLCPSPLARGGCSAASLVSGSSERLSLAPAAEGLGTDR